MKPEDRKAFAEVILAFAELKGKALSLPAVDLYWAAMQDWDIQEFRDAANHLLSTCQFMPMPYDFNELRKAGRMTAGEAFHEAMQVARNASPYGGNTSGDPLIDAVANSCGGYFAMGMTETEKLGFLERRFTEHYETMGDATLVREALPDLTPRRLPTNGPRHITDLLPNP